MAFDHDKFYNFLMAEDMSDLNQPLFTRNPYTSNDGTFDELDLPEESSSGDQLGAFLAGGRSYHPELNNNPTIPSPQSNVTNVSNVNALTAATASDVGPRSTNVKQPAPQPAHAQPAPVQPALQPAPAQLAHAQNLMNYWPPFDLDRSSVVVSLGVAFLALKDLKCQLSACRGFASEVEFSLNQIQQSLAGQGILGTTPPFDLYDAHPPTTGTTSSIPVSGTGPSTNVTTSSNPVSGFGPFTNATTSSVPVSGVAPFTNATNSLLPVFGVGTSTHAATPSIPVSGVGPFTNKTTSSIPASNTAASSDHVANETTSSVPVSSETSSSVDLSRDPRLGAKARLAAKAQISDHDNVSARAQPQRMLREMTPSSSSQVSTSDDGQPESSTTAMTRSNGPSDAIEGMLEGAGRDRLLMIDRASLPKGNIGGLSYCCEGRCGYDDGASDLISCDSAYHRRQKHLRLPNGKSGDRGWYHRPCGQVPRGDTPSTWICHSCRTNGRTSIHDQDHDDGDDGDQNDRPDTDAGDDSGDDFEPTPDTSDSSDDEDGDNDPKDDGDYNDSKRRREKGQNPVRYILDEDEDNQDDNQPGNVASAEGSQDQTPGSGNRKKYILDDDSEDDTTASPAKPITKGGKAWIEDEKVLAMSLMQEINADQKIFGEARFEAIARRMKRRGYMREWASVKNAWNRGLRERSGFDERKNKKAPLTTSKQDSETKRKNKEMKEQGRRSTTTETDDHASVRPKTVSQTEQQRQSSTTTEANGQASVRQRSASPKREYVSDEEDEVMPTKRRRPSPYDGDRFVGLS